MSPIYPKQASMIVEGHTLSYLITSTDGRWLYLTLSLDRDGVHNQWTFGQITMFDMFTFSLALLNIPCMLFQSWKFICQILSRVIVARVVKQTRSSCSYEYHIGYDIQYGVIRTITNHMPKWVSHISCIIWTLIKCFYSWTTFVSLKLSH